MPNRSHAVFPGLQENTTDHESPQVVDKGSEMEAQIVDNNVHLPHIRNDTPSNVKSERKHGRFFKFSNDRNSFTENLLSFFTGNKDRGGHEKSNNTTTEFRKNGTTSTKDSILRSRIETRRVSSRNERGNRGHIQQSISSKQPLRRTDKTRITAVTKNDSLRPVTGGSRACTSNGHVAKQEDDGDVGGYENMYKIKLPVGKFNVPRKRSLEISEYIRRENYKYNERTAKQFLFQKWLRSTEVELPEHYPIEHIDTILSK